MVVEVVNKSDYYSAGLFKICTVARDNSFLSRVYSPRPYILNYVDKEVVKMTTENTMITSSNTSIEPYTAIKPYREIRPYMAIQAYVNNVRKKFESTTGGGEKKRFPIILLVVLAVILFLAVSFWPKAAAENTAAVSTTAVAAQTATAPMPSAATMTKVINLLTSAGWDASQYTFAVDESKDPTTGGQEGDFSSTPIRSATTMVAFLKEASDGSNGLKSSVENSTGATESDVLNPDNWVAVQSTVPFQYPGNTGLKDGAIFGAGTLSGYAGEIFLVFIAPETVADTTSNSGTTTVRTACANPQTVCPQPSTSATTAVTPTVQPSSNDGKSSNINDWRHEEGKSQFWENEQSSAPADVASSVTSPNNSDIVDSVTNAPGSESGVTAPGATTNTIDAAKNTPTVEQGANPTSGGANSGDPGLPSGF